LQGRTCGFALKPGGHLGPPLQKMPHIFERKGAFQAIPDNLILTAINNIFFAAAL
jgi:hypothetical protein